MPTGTTTQLIDDLRGIRRRNGMPSFAELARRTGYPRSTLHDALRGDRLPACDLVVALAEACGEPGPAWKERWIAAAAAEQDDPRPDASAGRPAPSETPPARRISVRTALVVSAAAALTGAGVALLGTSDEPCVPARDYRVTRAGAVLDAAGSPIGEVRTADVVQVRTLTHDRYPHRYFGTVARTGISGYVDEAKLTYTAPSCTS
ncbi:helix-turn-helix transcriptional regulator [Amycolatopsis sp. NPDC051102]|uniref:helix-turn-helix domain-containing protein n=1 Tax=Amycolatopsis sp. NPDC051102 TaxID=3155163 RepID=UPI0034434397